MTKKNLKNRIEDLRYTLRCILHEAQMAEVFLADRDTTIRYIHELATDALNNSKMEV